MIGAYPVLVRSRRPFRPTVTRADILWFVVAVILAVAAVTSVTFVGLTLAPPVLQLGIANGARDLPLDSGVSVQLGGWDARLESAALYDTGLGPDGRRRESEVPLDVQIARSGWLPGQRESTVWPAAGTLRPDRTYRLVVRASALQAALPLPRVGTIEREISFTTPASPRPKPVAELTQLNWDAPLAIRWNMPLAEIRHEVAPPAASRAWIDPEDRQTAYVLIEDAEEAATYRVTISDAVGVSGIRQQQSAAYTVVTPSRPRPIRPEEPLRAELGQPVNLRFDQPMASLRYEIKPALPGTGRIDPDDPTQVQLQFDGLAQGEQYELRLGEALARSGAPLAEPVSLTLETPPPLAVAEFLPGSSWVTITAQPTIVFSEPVRDRAAVESAVTVEPALPGHFEWLDDSRLQFVPRDSMPYNTRVTLTVSSGPDGPRSTAGGYLEADATYAFRTAPNKTIDVDVSRQVMTLIEGDRAVRTLVVATGIPGADTPIGEFRVQYKMPTARFRGYNAAAGHAYDLSNVKWVLAFMGDYTIHGAYWRQAFGQPGSNGCVSLTDADAKIVYDWAPEGTLIRIHY